MFLHSGASLHGHEYHTPQNQPRKRPFLRSALPNPILRSNSSATLPNTYTPSSPPPQRPLARRRPVSEAYVRPISALLKDDSPPRTAASSAPVVRFKDLDIVHSPIRSSMLEEDPSVYDSDASQASCSTPRRRKRRPAAVRKSTNYLVAVPPPNLSSKKALFKTIRPRLLLQLQQLAANERARPTLDVFPASLNAGPLATAPYIHRFPRMFGAKRELGPRDLILVKSEDYTADEVGEESSGSRRQPVAVLSPGRGQADVGEIVLDDGSDWTCSSQKSHYSFVHVDEHGSSLTVRWVKRSAVKRASGAPMSPEISPVLSPPISGSSNDTTESDYRYTFSIINPLTRRHPILATLSPQSLEIYDEYTTPSSSSGRYPPTRPVSGAFDSAGHSSRDPPLSPLLGNEPSTQRETHTVDEDTKKLIMVTGLWLALRLGPSFDSTDAGESASCSQDTPKTTPSCTFQSTFQTLPRRQTTSNASTTPPLPVQPTRIRRAMSTGAAFMQRRKQKDWSEAPSSTSTMVGLGKMSLAESPISEDVSAPAAPSPALKQARRTSWFKRLTH